MSFITLDWETYYSKTYSLSKMTTEEYIRDPRFEVIGVGIKIDDEESQWFSGSHAEIKEWLSQFDWDESAVLCHNTLFDAAILEWVFDFHPKFYFDTLGMARALHGTEVGGSLASLSERYKLGRRAMKSFMQWASVSLILLTPILIIMGLIVAMMWILLADSSGSCR